MKDNNFNELNKFIFINKINKVSCVSWNKSMILKKELPEAENKYKKINLFN